MTARACRHARLPVDVTSLLPLAHPSTGPRPRWLIGNLLEIHTEGQEGAAERWVAEYGPLFLIWLGGFPVSRWCKEQLIQACYVTGSGVGGRVQRSAALNGQYTQQDGCAVA